MAARAGKSTARKGSRSAPQMRAQAAPLPRWTPKRVVAALAWAAAAITAFGVVIGGVFWFVDYVSKWRASDEPPLAAIMRVEALKRAADERAEATQEALQATTEQLKGLQATAQDSRARSLQRDLEAIRAKIAETMARLSKTPSSVADQELLALQRVEEGRIKGSIMEQASDPVR